MAGNSGYVDFFGTNYGSTQTLSVYWQETVSDAVGAKSTVAITKIQLSSPSYVGDTYYADMVIKINGTTAITLANNDGNGVYLTDFNTFYDVTRGGNQITGSVSNISHDANGSKSVSISIEPRGFDYAGFWRSGAHFSFTTTSASKSITLFTIPVATLSISAATGTTITVKRSGTTLASGANLYYGQQLVITFGVTTGYQLDSHTVNGTSFTSGGTHTVGATPTTVAVATTASQSLSTISTGSGTFGTAQTITVTRYVNTYTHTIKATCAGQTQTIATKSSSTSISWTPAVSIMNSITNAMSATATLTCTTYNGDTNLGSTSITVTLSLPTSGTYSVKPTPTITHTDANGYAATYGGYVAGKSVLSVTISDGLKYGATILTRSTTANRVASGASSFNAGLLTGDTTISTSIKDSRQQTGTASASITVQAYTSPSITTFSVHRTTSGGVADDSGNYFVVSWAVAITSLSNNNTRSLKLRYKRVTASTWTEQTITLSAYSDSGTTAAISASGDYSWDVQLVLADGFETITKATKLSTALVVESRRPNGTGVAFGKVAEQDDLFDIQWPVQFRSRAASMQNLAYLGTNPITSVANDTQANWLALGSGFAYFNAVNQITDQPAQWGIVLNLVSGNNVTQIWMTQPSGATYRRGANLEGWAGTWRRFSDSEDDPLTASTLDNYRFIKPDAVVKPVYALPSVNSQGMTCDGTDVYITYRASADDAQTMNIAKISLQSILDGSPVISKTGSIGAYHLNNLAYYDGKIYCFNGSSDTEYNNIIVVVDASTLTVIKTVNFVTKMWGGAVVKPRQTIGEVLIIQPEYSKNLDYYASYNDDNNHGLFPLTTVNLNFTGTETFQGAWHANSDRLYAVCTAYSARTKASGNQVIRVYSYRGELMREWYIPSLVQSPGIELEDVWVDDNDEVMLVNDASGNIYVFALPEIYSTMQTEIARSYSLVGNLIHAYINPSPLDVTEPFNSYYGGTISVQASFPFTDLAFISAAMGDMQGFGFVSPYRFPIFSDSRTERIWLNGHIPFSNGDSTDFSFTYGRKLSTSGNNYIFALMSVSITATDISAHSATVYSATASSESEWGVLTNHSSGMGKAISDAAAGGWLPGNVYVNHVDYTVGVRRLYNFNGQDLLN